MVVTTGVKRVSKADNYTVVKADDLEWCLEK